MARLNIERQQRLEPTRIEYAVKRIEELGYYVVNRGVHFIAEDVIANPLNTHEDYIVDPETVGQYTGMKDSNGMEIYEGDIVKAPLLDPIFGDILSDAFDNAAISFHNGSYAVAYYKGRHKIYLQDLYDKIEVIGNIHDNPELLEGGSNGQTAE